MKRNIILAVMIFVLSVGCTIITGADAMVDNYIPVSASYDIQVAASDGGVNFRYGPGVQYGKILSDMIPNGVVLHVNQEAQAANGNTWANVYYNGYYGWVALSECSVYHPQPALPSAATTYKDARHVSYTMEVTAWDGGVNLREGPGVEYDKVLDYMIPTGTVLLAVFEDEASNGVTWCFVNYDRRWGWVSSTECTQLPAREGHMDIPSTYKVKVSAPDGGIYLRQGPGVENPPVLSQMIPNGTILLIDQEATASNGKWWGYTTWQGASGWVTLVQITPEPGAVPLQD